MSYLSFTDDQPKIPPWEEDDGIYGIMVSTAQRHALCRHVYITIL